MNKTMGAIDSELLGFKTESHVIMVDFLLPNGFFVTLGFSRYATLAELKDKLWRVLDESLFQLQKDKNCYAFSTVNTDGQLFEYYNLNTQLCDLNLLHWFFVVFEIQGTIEEKRFNADLTKAVGLNVEDLGLLKNRELMIYRLNLLNTSLEELSNSDADQEFKCLYSPDIDVDPSRFDTVNTVSNTSPTQKRVQLNLLVYDLEEPSQQPIDVILSSSDKPVDVVTGYFRNKLQYSAPDMSSYELDMILNSYRNEYALRVCGSREIMIGEQNCLTSYRYIRKCLSNQKVPRLYLVPIEKLKSSSKTKQKQFQMIQMQKCIFEQKERLDRSLRASQNPILSWNCNLNFWFYVYQIGLLPTVIDFEKIFFRAAIFHGQDPISEIFESQTYEVERIGRNFKNPYLMINRDVRFNIKIQDLPRCSKLCICFYYKLRKKKEENSLSWICFDLFDYEGQFVDGGMNVFMWSVDRETSFINMFQNRVSGPNPEKNSVKLKLEFMRHSNIPNHIFYPDLETIRRVITLQASSKEFKANGHEVEDKVEKIKRIVNKDQLAELTEQDKKFLWDNRDLCHLVPSSLSKLLQSVKWSTQANIIDIYSLVFKWPSVPPIIALELLGSSFPDPIVRSLAVDTLDKCLSGEEVQVFILQFIQALKNESYMNNALSKFLLSRGLKSTRIGFNLFWSLKTESKDIRYKYRFGLILEAYCRGLNSSPFQQLLKQINSIDKLAQLTQYIKSTPDNIYLITGTYLQDTLGHPECKETVSNFVSPLNQSIFVGEIDPLKSRILSSAKRPLFLSWLNNTEFAELNEKYHQLIFKNGDDLRQDMLTLQALKLMDTIWKNEGLDLKMLIYDCYSTGSKLGFIEVIKESLTVFKIQTESGKRGKFQIDTDQLLRWIQANNPNEKFAIAIDNFTKSCAAFCVATFILGIGDRHPDNIMVNKEGKLFHVDFGHFLGHFKKKFGIKRERVPFVLIQDFIRVISKGEPNPTEKFEFQQFRALCERAYMTIRRYSNLFINIFSLMLSSGLQELQSLEDVMYLRNKLALDLPNDKALDFFRSQFDEAYSLSFTTKFDWVFHALNKKNQI